MHVIGLTGQSGSGKSLLSQRFLTRGIPVLDADQISHQVTESDLDCLKALREKFGSHIFDEAGKLSRKKLGTVVFSSPDKLNLLNVTVFPFITQEIERQIRTAEAEKNTLLLLDAPTLYEAGADRFCSYVIAVCAPFELRLERVIKRDMITREAALLRLSAQKEDDFYRTRADYVICNKGTEKELIQKADEMIDLLIRRFSLPDVR